MAKNTEASLGILLLDREGASPPTTIPGSLHNAATFDFPVIWETVTGAWAKNVIEGDPALRPAYAAAARRLADRGAVAITSNCGFAMRYQSAVAAAVDIPVALSSMLLASTLLQQMPAFGKLAVVTADASHFTEDLLQGIPLADRARILVAGIEGGDYWRGALERPPRFAGLAVVEREVAACIDRLLATEPGIGAVLFECATFPMVSAKIRGRLRLPVFDIADVGRLIFASRAGPAIK